MQSPFLPCVAVSMLLLLLLLVLVSPLVVSRGDHVSAPHGPLLPVLAGGGWRGPGAGGGLELPRPPHHLHLDVLPRIPDGGHGLLHRPRDHVVDGHHSVILSEMKYKYINIIV